MSISLLKAVEAQLVQDILSNDRDYSYFHPSEWNDCHRKLAYLYYEYKGHISVSQDVIKIDPCLQRIFDNGHFMHDRWRSYVEKTGMLRGKWMCQNVFEHKTPKIYGSDDKWGVFCPEQCECGSKKFIYEEVGFYDEDTMWGGHVDAIIDTKGIANTDPSPEDLIVVDFKSIHPMSFTKLSAPLEKHMTQMQIYLYLSGIALGKFVYESKGNQQVKEYDVPADVDLMKIKKAEAKKLKYIVLNSNSSGKRVLPLRDKKYSSRAHKECVDCKFRANCWELE